MYVIEMKPDRQFNMGEYCFKTKAEVQEWLERLTDYQIGRIISIDKLNKHSTRSAWYDFFKY